MSWPTSLISMRPDDGSMVKVNGLRSPSAQMARLSPVVCPKNGLLAGMLPSALMRRILPSGVLRLWALSPTAFSPTPI